MLKIISVSFCLLLLCHAKSNLLSKSNIKEVIPDQKALYEGLLRFCEISQESRMNKKCTEYG